MPSSNRAQMVGKENIAPDLHRHRMPANGPIEFPIAIGDTIASPSGDDVSSSDDIDGSNGDF